MSDFALFGVRFLSSLTYSNDSSVILICSTQVSGVVKAEILCFSIYFLHQAVSCCIFFLLSSFLNEGPLFEQLTANNGQVEIVSSFKLLGTIITSSLSWDQLARYLYALKPAKDYMPFGY